MFCSSFQLYYSLFQACLNPEGGIDAYSFLNMVRSTAGGEESVTACLGAEVDDLILEDEDWNLSPEHHSSSDKPTFEDSAEFQDFLGNQPAESNWGKASSLKDGSWSAGNWDVDKNDSAGKEKPWSLGMSSAETNDVGWDTAATRKINSSWNSENDVTQSNSLSGWATKKSETHNGFATKVQEKPARSNDWDVGTAWGRKAGDNKFANVTKSWWGKVTDGDESEQNKNKQRQEDQELGTHGWDDKMSPDQLISGWASTTTQEATTESCSSKAASVWGTKNTNVDEQGSENHVLLNQAKESSDWNKKSNSNQTDAACGSKAASSWGAKNTDADKRWGSKVDLNQADTSCSWGRSKTPDRGWGLSNSGGSNGSEMENKTENQSLLDRGKESGCWGEKNTDADKPWSNKVNSNQADTASGWGKSKSLDRGWGVSNSGGGNGNEMNNKTENQSQLEGGKESGGWGAKNTDADKPWGNKVNSNQADTASCWGKPKLPDLGWGVSSSGGGNGSEMEDKTENQALLDRGKESGGWGKPKSPEISQGWGSSKDSVKAVDGWGVPNSAGSNGSERDQQWGQQSGEFKKNRTEGSRGWGSNNGDWKKRNRPSKPHEDSSSSGLFTTTRQRLDIFTSQEQDILSDVEPLMLSIRRIMHQTGYVFYAVHS